MIVKVYRILVVVLLFQTFVFGQSDKQKALETQRIQLQKEITQINSLLFSNKKKKSRF